MKDKLYNIQLKLLFVPYIIKIKLNIYHMTAEWP